MPYLRHDSVDAPSLWELEEMERMDRLAGIGGGNEIDGGVVHNTGLQVPEAASAVKRERSWSLRSKT